MSEDEDDPDEALLPGLLTGKVRRMPPVLSIRSSLPRIHLRKVFLSVLTVTILLILYYYFRGTNEEVKRLVTWYFSFSCRISTFEFFQFCPGKAEVSIILLRA
jgi:hypothetical protein